MVSYHHVQYQKKQMIQSWENLGMDGQTDESDFIGRCTTNVKRSKGNFILKNTEHSIMICGNTNNYIRKNSWQV